jgi:hypothetical protein
MERKYHVIAIGMKDKWIEEYENVEESRLVSIYDEIGNKLGLN